MMETRRLKENKTPTIIYARKVGTIITFSKRRRTDRERLNYDFALGEHNNGYENNKQANRTKVRYCSFGRDRHNGYYY